MFSLLLFWCLWRCSCFSRSCLCPLLFPAVLTLLHVSFFQFFRDSPVRSCCCHVVFLSPVFMELFLWTELACYCSLVRVFAVFLILPFPVACLSLFLLSTPPCFAYSCRPSLFPDPSCSCFLSLVVPVVITSMFFMLLSPEPVSWSCLFLLPASRCSSCHNLHVFHILVVRACLFVIAWSCSCRRRPPVPSTSSPSAEHSGWCGPSSSRPQYRWTAPGPSRPGRPSWDCPRTFTARYAFLDRYRTFRGSFLDCTQGLRSQVGR